MSPENLLLSQTHYATGQGLVFTFENDAAGWHNLGVLNVTVKRFFLTLFKLLFFILFRLASFFVDFDRSIQETVLGILVCSRESIKNVTSVSIGIFKQLLFQESVQNVVGYSDRQGGPVNFRPLCVFWWITPGLFD